MVKRTVAKVMDGPGYLLGYRVLHKKIREVHNLNVPRNVVYDVMADVNPQASKTEVVWGNPIKRPRRIGTFT